MNKNSKNIFLFKKLNTHDLCVLGLLLGIAVVMGMFFTIRPTQSMKIPTKFFPVAISAVLYGPFWGGIVGLLSDLISYALNPTAGMLLPQITFVEFLYGFTYGLFLKNVRKEPKGYLKGVLCVGFQIIFLHILLTTYFLVPVFGMSFKLLLITRLPAALINLLLQTAGIILIVKYTNTFQKISGGIK